MQAQKGLCMNMFVHDWKIFAKDLCDHIAMHTDVNTWYNRSGLSESPLSEHAVIQMLFWILKCQKTI